jgi:phosphotransferase system HPr (HPr) family protein
MNGQLLKSRLMIIGSQGLHMRPAAAFAERAREFQCAITIRKIDKCVDGKSVWDILLLAAEQGTELTVETAGPDAAEAMSAVVGVLVGLEVAADSSG